MKNLIFLFFLLITASCGSDKVKHPAPSANPDAHADHDHADHDHAGHDHAADNSNIVTNPDGTVHVKGDVTAFLVGLWEIEYALVGSTPKVDTRYKGAWIDMKGDFTFTTGIYDKVTNKGTYKYQAEPVRLLNFSFEKEEKILPSEAKVQGQGMQMVLLGETPMDGKQSQIKLGQTSKKPTRSN